MALIDRDKRERAKRLKAQWIEQILQAGLRAFMSFAYVDVTLDSVRKLAGVPQGKPEIYFGSREELFLQVFSREAERWFDDLDRRLDGDDGPLDRSQLAELIADSLEARRELLRLLGLLHVVLDQNIDVVSGGLFLRKLKTWMTSCAGRIEGRCPWLGAGAGFVILNRFINYASCLYSVGHPTGAFAMMVDDDELSGMRVDLESELRFLVERLVA